MVDKEVSILSEVRKLIENLERLPVNYIRDLFKVEKISILPDPIVSIIYHSIFKGLPKYPKWGVTIDKVGNLDVRYGDASFTTRIHPESTIGLFRKEVTNYGNPSSKE